MAQVNYVRFDQIPAQANTRQLIAWLDRTIDALEAWAADVERRLENLETTAADHEARISALEP